MTMHYYGILKWSWTQGGPGDPFFTTAVNTFELKEANQFDVTFVQWLKQTPVDCEVNGSILSKNSR